MASQELINHLESRADFWTSDRLASLEQRKLDELEFHNLDRKLNDPEAAALRADTKMRENQKWYSVDAASRDYVSNWIGTHAKGKTFLDYACGNGGPTIFGAEQGASLAVGLDISDESIRNARAAAVQAGVADRCVFVQGDCEATEFPDASFDTILCSGMLHHLDLSRAYPELARILRPGGRILAVEALAGNPLIAGYRKRTPTMRTEWEAQHILSYSDAMRAKQWFDLGDVRFWHLAVLGAVPFRNSNSFPRIRSAGNAIDRVLMATPGVRRLAWQFTFELVRRN
jgi:SAM-dependent methyltransferase